MKKITLLTLILFVNLLAFTQEKIEKSYKLPEVNIKTPEGQTFNTSNISNNGKPVIISFWATWCTNCVKELNSISEVYGDWQKETGVKLVAISIDDARNSSKVMPFVNGRNWDYEVYLDVNKDFYRAMHVGNVPFTVLLNGKGEIIWQHTSYEEGGEVQLFDLVKKLAAGQDIK